MPCKFSNRLLNVCDKVVTDALTVSPLFLKVFTAATIPLPARSLIKLFPKKSRVDVSKPDTNVVTNVFTVLNTADMTLPIVVNIGFIRSTMAPMVSPILENRLPMCSSIVALLLKPIEDASIASPPLQIATMSFLMPFTISKTLSFIFFSSPSTLPKTVPCMYSYKVFLTVSNTVEMVSMTFVKAFLTVFPTFFIHVTAVLNAETTFPSVASRIPVFFIDVSRLIKNFATLSKPSKTTLEPLPA